MKKIKINEYKKKIYFFFEIVFVIIMAFLFVKYFGLKVSNAGDSMDPVIKNGEAVFVNRILYDAKSPKRGDVVAFRPKGDLDAHCDIKRIIGLPGEKVLIKDNKIYINDVVIIEKYKTSKIKDEGQAEETITLNEDEYFVLGDNRDRSIDSRDVNFGMVKKKYIVGRVWIVIRPIKNMHLVNQGE